MVTRQSILAAIAEAEQSTEFIQLLALINRVTSVDPELVASAIRSANAIYRHNSGAAHILLQQTFVILRAQQIERGSDVDELEMWYSRVGGAK